MNLSSHNFVSEHFYISNVTHKSVFLKGEGDNYRYRILEKNSKHSKTWFSSYPAFFLNKNLDLINT